MRVTAPVTDYIRASVINTKGDLVVRGDLVPELLRTGADGTFFRGKGAGEIPGYEIAEDILGKYLMSNGVGGVPSWEWVMQIETKILEDTTIGLAVDSVNDLDVIGFSFTPTAILNVSIVGWVSIITEGEAGQELSFFKDTLFGSEPTRSWRREIADVTMDLHITKATPGTNKVIVRVANYNELRHYRLTCTACKTH